MAGKDTGPEPFVLDDFELEKKRWPFPGRFRDGARASALNAGSLIRVNWLTLVDVDPETIPWAEANGNDDPPHTGRASVVGARYAAMLAAGELSTTAREVVIREWEGQVQISGGFEQNGLFHWGDDNMFTAAVFAESPESRVAMGVRSGGQLAIPEGVFLLGQVPPKELPHSHPGLSLAA